MEEVRDLVFEVQCEQVPVKSSLEELKGYVAELNQAYVSTPITTDNVRKAKEQLASFRKVRKAITDKMNSVKKEILMPFEALNSEVKAIMSTLDHIEVEMDKGIKDIVEAERLAKMAQVQTLLAEMRKALEPEVKMLVENYYDNGFNNKTCSETSIRNIYGRIISEAQAVWELIKTRDNDKVRLISAFKRSYSFTDVKREMNFIDEENTRYAQAQEERKKEEEASLIPLKEEPQPQEEVPIKKAEPTQKKVVIATFKLLGTVEDIADIVRYANELGVKTKREGAVIRASEVDEAQFV